MSCAQLQSVHMKYNGKKTSAIYGFCRTNALLFKGDSGDVAVE